ncbi:MAG: ATP phosphoribosyltransferase regulatory subunit [Synergistales bacterium]
MSRQPKGTRTLGGNEGERVERCRKVFFETFSAYGYVPFFAPGLQLLESAWDKFPPRFRKRLITVYSPSSEACCLRADMTLAAVSYLSSHYSPQERPLRLCYAGPLYRAPIPPETDFERMQFGAELLGWEGEGADVEVTALLLRSLRQLGIHSPVVVLGHAGFLRECLGKLDRSVSIPLMQALLERRYEAYFASLADFHLQKEMETRLASIPRLRGNAASILAKAKDLFGETSPLKDLSLIVEALGELGLGENLRLDLALARELEYYSGPVFEIFSGNAGVSLGGGGRYDGLLEQYGIVGQALGFGLDLRAVASLSRFEGSMPAVAWCGGLSPRVALERADDFIASGYRVELSWQEKREAAVQLARTRGYDWWIDLAGCTAYRLETTGKERD